jgi:hypothetical protein
MLMLAMALATAAGATSFNAARLMQNPFLEPGPAAAQGQGRPPEPPGYDPPEPPPPPRGEGRERPPMFPPMMAASGIQMAASGKFVYILRGDEILQFEATSLEFVKKVKLPQPERPNRRDGDGGRDKRKDDRPPPKPRYDE